MSDETTPGPDLRERIAQALTREHYRRAELRIEASPEEHQAGFADVVMAVLRAHAAEIDPADLRTPIASVIGSTMILRTSPREIANAIRASVLDPFVIRLSEAVDEVVAAKDAEIEQLREEITEANAYGNAAQKRLAESHSESAQLRKTLEAAQAVETQAVDYVDDLNQQIAEATQRAEKAEAERERLDVRINEIVTGFSNANRLHHVDQTSNTCTTCVRTYPCPTVNALNAIDDQASVVIAERDELKAAVTRGRVLATSAARTGCGAGWDLDPAEVLAALDLPAVREFAARHDPRGEV